MQAYGIYEKADPMFANVFIGRTDIATFLAIYRQVENVYIPQDYQISNQIG